MKKFLFFILFLFFINLLFVVEAKADYNSCSCSFFPKNPISGSCPSLYNMSSIFSQRFHENDDIDVIVGVAQTETITFDGTYNGCKSLESTLKKMTNDSKLCGKDETWTSQGKSEPAIEIIDCNYQKCKGGKTYDSPICSYQSTLGWMGVEDWSTSKPLEVEIDKEKIITIIVTGAEDPDKVKITFTPDTNNIATWTPEENFSGILKIKITKEDLKKFLVSTQSIKLTAEDLDDPENEKLEKTIYFQVSTKSLIEHAGDKKVLPTEEYEGAPFSVPDVSELSQLNVKSIPDLIGNLIKTALGFIGSIALVMFVGGGLLWMTSMGNSERQKKAMNMILWSSLGVLVILSSYVIVSFVLRAFGI